MLPDAVLLESRQRLPSCCVKGRNQCTQLSTLRARDIYICGNSALVLQHRLRDGAVLARRRLSRLRGHAVCQVAVRLDEDFTCDRSIGTRAIGVGDDPGAGSAFRESLHALRGLYQV